MQTLRRPLQDDSRARTFAFVRDGSGCAARADVGAGSLHRIKSLLLQWVARRRGGEGGIRTPDTVARMPHFECGAFNHSATSPQPEQGSSCGARSCNEGRGARQGWRRGNRHGAGAAAAPPARGLPGSRRGCCRGRCPLPQAVVREGSDTGERVLGQTLAWVSRVHAPAVPPVARPARDASLRQPGSRRPPGALVARPVRA